MPGVPDVYQGTEVWEDSLVDPDNRRPVDFARQRAVLGGLTGAPAGRRDGGGEALGHRRRRCGRGPSTRSCSRGYHPLSADGPAAEHLVAYDRGGAMTLATRLPIGLVRSGGWGDTTDRAAESGRGPADRSAVTRARPASPSVLVDLPVALLVGRA